MQETKTFSNLRTFVLGKQFSVITFVAQNILEWSNSLQVLYLALMFPSSVQTRVFNKRVPLVLSYWSVARTMCQHVSKVNSSNTASSIKQQTFVTRD